MSDIDDEDPDALFNADQSRYDRERERKIDIRDRIIHELQLSGVPMTPRELGKILNLGWCTISSSAKQWSAYFVYKTKHKNIVTFIDLHQHLKGPR